MIALDTNVLVRLLTRDDENQARRAAALLRGNPVAVAKTVLLEAEWVLRRGYGLDRGVIESAFERLLGLENLAVENGPAVARALRWYADGFDFADALHLASCGPEDRFATFDRELARSAARLVDAPAVIEP